MSKVTNIDSTPINVVFLSPKVSYAAVVDSENNEVEITEEMIEEACESVDEELEFPFARSASR